MPALGASRRMRSRGVETEGRQRVPERGAVGPQCLDMVLVYRFPWVGPGAAVRGGSVPWWQSACMGRLQDKAVYAGGGRDAVVRALGVFSFLLFSSRARSAVRTGKAASLPGLEATQAKAKSRSRGHSSTRPRAAFNAARACGERVAPLRGTGRSQGWERCEPELKSQEN